MTADDYLQGILQREAVDTGIYSTVRGVQSKIQPAIQEWAGNFLLGLSPSGSFAKGTANHCGTDIDLFISLAQHIPSRFHWEPEPFSLASGSCHVGEIPAAMKRGSSVLASCLCPQTNTLLRSLTSTSLAVPDSQVPAGITPPSQLSPCA
jgi:hypothetical protein